MSEEISTRGDDDSEKRKRRRRRRKRGSANPAGGMREFDDLLVADDSAPKRKKGRRQAVEVTGPAVSLPSSGRNPYKKRGTRTRRKAPGSAGARRRHLSRGQLDDISGWLAQAPDQVVANLYRGLGGQPNRVAGRDRMIQLTVRAIAQGSRISAMLKNTNERDRKALAALVQAGGVAHANEFHRELILSFGGHDREWKKVLVALANKGVVVSSHESDGEFFYVIPEPLLDGLIEELEADLSLPTFAHDDVRVMDAVPFCPPLDFSITSLATYIDQNAPRLTQRQEIYRHDQEEMDRFFSQIWKTDSELFQFHLDFLMMHGMVELRGEYLSLNREVMDEWLGLEAEDQRDLMFRALEKRFPMAEWVLWAIHAATAPEGDESPESLWVAERPLVSQYRRWQRGEDWRDRYQRGAFNSVRTSDRESYSFAPLVRAGILDLGQWGQEKFYRLSARGRMMLEPGDDDGFTQFYLTPSYEIMAPAGLAPVLLFRIGELATLVGCDRMNTYRIAEERVEKALKAGWRRDDVLQFLRDNSQIGLPDNVESTLKGWIGHRGEVEFHDLMLMTVHRSQIRRLEGNKRVKPYLLHRFAPGMYAVDRTRKDEIMAALEDNSFQPAAEVRGYPGDPEHVGARNALHRMVAEARQLAIDPAQRGRELAPPEKLQMVPGTRLAKLPDGEEGEEDDPIPEVTVLEVRRLADLAMSKDLDVEMVYLAKNGLKLELVVAPQRFAFKGDSPVLVGIDKAEDERRTFVLERIERMRILGLDE
ncbi:MAG: helicase-associated domain-containing protein [Myxococcota bacterium]